MQQKITLKLLPNEAETDALLKKYIANACNVNINEVIGFYITKKSVDARAKTIWVNLTIAVFINEPFAERNLLLTNFRSVKKSTKKVIIIGAGPAGLFAALQLLELGIKPIIIERGKDVRARRRDLATLNKEGIINPESNYCFGEGGAGTYSDGKLYTRSNKRGSIDKILHHFVRFGADEKILYEAHPHIGTNKLPNIITAIRQQILDCGGEYYFEKKLVDFVIENDIIKSIKTADGDTLVADAFILATGHSARDIFELLHKKQILIEAKPFALGVRIEHPQEIINSCQYKSNAASPFLAPASYSLVEQVNGKGVFSFCMCPGGIIAPAATAPNELVVNGWSPSKRNNPFANSGMVVEVSLKDATENMKIRNSKFENSPLLMMHFQQQVEQTCYTAAGGKFIAPAQRMADFVNNISSSTLPNCSYLPGVSSVALKDVLPHFVNNALRYAFTAFGKKMKGYYTNEAIVVATESRTSSPVKIPRDVEMLYHPQLKNLYPCGEGAGYAGGIVSAAMDGEKVARQCALLF